MTTISFKLNAEDARVLRERARRERLTVSEFLRRRAVASSSTPVEVKRRKCPLTGAMIFDANETLPPLTVESTREMLGEFP